MPEIVKNFFSKSPIITGALDEYGKSLPEAHQLLLEFKNTQKMWVPLDEKLLGLRKEYAYLFLTPRGVHPYESVYRGTKKRLMDKPWEQVKNFYRKWGMEKGETEEHPEDHVSVELGFMAVLAWMTFHSSQKGESGDDILVCQQEFFTNHLNQWLPQLCTDIEKREKAPAYGALAKMLHNFLELEKIALDW